MTVEIRYEKDEVYAVIKKRVLKVRMPFSFYKDISGYPEIRHYFLQSSGSEIRSREKSDFYLKKDYCIPKPDSCLNKVRARHDPLPDHSLDIIPFVSLESAQWHLLVHGFADYWLNPDKPYIMPIKS